MTPRQSRFVEEYLIDLNASQAAIRAKYKGDPNTIGPRLLANVGVQEAIARRMAERSKRMEITQDRVLKERARLAFFDVRKLLDNAGNPLPIQALDDDTAAAIAGLDVAVIGNAEVGEGQILKIKWADKNVHLTALEKHLGMYKDGTGDSPPLHIHLHL